MNCPTCKGTMVEKDFGGVHVDVCETCKGVWFDNHELKKLDEKNEGFGRALEDALSSDYHKVENRPQIKCPKCDMNMVERHYFSQTQVLVDECYGCGGFFLDAGEFESIRENHLTEEERDQVIDKILEDVPENAPVDGDDGANNRREAVSKLVNYVWYNFI